MAEKTQGRIRLTAEGNVKKANPNAAKPPASRARKPTTSNHPLMDLIPDVRFAEEYVHRNIDGINDFEVFEYHYKQGDNILFCGDTGLGKTTAVRAFCASKRIPYVRIPCDRGFDPKTLWGIWVPDSTGSLEWNWSEPAKVVMYGGILLLDDVNFIPPSAAGVFYSLLDDDRTAKILEAKNQSLRANDNFFCVGAYNDSYEGTFPLNKAFRRRFKHIDWDASEEVELELISCPILLIIANALRNSYRSATLSIPVATDSLMDFERFAMDLGIDYAIARFVNQYPRAERDSVSNTIELHRIEIETQISKMIELSK